MSATPPGPAGLDFKLTDWLQMFKSCRVENSQTNECLLGCATTVLVTSAGMGEMLLQVLVGSVMHNRGSFSFLLCGMIFSCLGFVFFLLLFFVQHNHKNFTEVLPNNLPMERLEENGIKTCSGAVLNSWEISEQ